MIPGTENRKCTVTGDPGQVGEACRLIALLLDAPPDFTPDSDLSWINTHYLPILDVIDCASPLKQFITDTSFTII